MWEFVGGKVEEGESKERALERECKEELDIQIAVGEQFAEVMHVYSDITVHLTLFNAVIYRGEPQLIEHKAIKWIRADEIPEYEFCPADKVFLDLIRSNK